MNRIFEKEKLTVMKKISNEVLKSTNFDISTEYMDFVKDQLTAKLAAFIYADTVVERKLEYWFDRPTFFDWLFRRRRKAIFKLKIKDILLNAPEIEKNVLRIYRTEPIKNK